ncbi:hypothetical protein HNQ94_001845 [Salirhabdus euzebyi]|uniref:Uncharacterized protein n=1 Tax=Salirhabdus euzebyi TaxID=394506 RepID=A0A841Q4Q9_9BACI|nr:hypothetical protein [Salirhabdus euzebyi]MBB6453396.1 hypothetical protein [Salirhabdus euzebyi]
MHFLNSKHFIIGLTIFYLTSFPTQANSNLNQPIIHENKININSIHSITNEGQPSLTEETIVAITDKFMDHLVQEVDNNYQVVNYRSKEELANSFSSFSSLSLAKKIVDLYYKEHDNKLYIIPTETPPWFVHDQPYTKTEISKNHIEIVQTNSSDLYGNYKIKMQFKYIDDKGWTIEDVNYPKE